MKLRTMQTLLIKQPAAWIPLLMSLAAASLVMVYMALYFPVQEQASDEGGFARTFQLLLMLQLPLIAWFVIKWLPKEPAQTLVVLGLQAFAWLGAISLILWLEM